jgi:hypothetical protein
MSTGFRGRRRPGVELPPSQYLAEDFPVLSAGPTPGRSSGSGATEDGGGHDQLQPLEPATRSCHAWSTAQAAPGWTCAP